MISFINYFRTGIKVFYLFVSVVAVVYGATQLLLVLQVSPGAKENSTYIIGAVLGLGFLDLIMSAFYSLKNQHLSSHSFLVELQTEQVARQKMEAALVEQKAQAESYARALDETTRNAKMVASNLLKAEEAKNNAEKKFNELSDKFIKLTEAVSQRLMQMNDSIKVAANTRDIQESAEHYIGVVQGDLKKAQQDVTAPTEEEAVAPTTTKKLTLLKNIDPSKTLAKKASELTGVAAKSPDETNAIPVDPDEAAKHLVEGSEEWEDLTTNTTQTKRDTTV